MRHRVIEMYDEMPLRGAVTVSFYRVYVRGRVLNGKAIVKVQQMPLLWVRFVSCDLWSSSLLSNNLSCFAHER